MIFIFHCLFFYIFKIYFLTSIIKDAGDYICRAESGAEVRLHLRVDHPAIHIRPIEVGSHYVALAWNDSLKVNTGNWN